LASHIFHEIANFKKILVEALKLTYISIHIVLDFVDFGAVVFWGQTGPIWFCWWITSVCERAAALCHFKTTT